MPFLILNTPDMLGPPLLETPATLQLQDGPLALQSTLVLHQRCPHHLDCLQSTKALPDEKDDAGKSNPHDSKANRNKEACIEEALNIDLKSRRELPVMLQHGVNVARNTHTHIQTHRTRAQPTKGIQVPLRCRIVHQSCTVIRRVIDTSSH